MAIDVDLVPDEPDENWAPYDYETPEYDETEPLEGREETKVVTNGQPMVSGSEDSPNPR